MAATLSDIARRVGVTKTTVSLVLNGKPSGLRISKLTRQRIMTTAQELDYRPSLAARALVTGRTYAIGFLCGHIESPHYNELAAVAMREVERRGYHLLISVTEWRDERNDLDCLDTVLARGVDGVIFFGCALKPHVRVYDRIVADEFPLVTISDDVPGLSSVWSDWQPGMNEAVALLKSRGHTRLAFGGSEYSDRSTNAKLVALDRACIEQGMMLREFVIRGNPVAGREEGRQFARHEGRESAVIISCDYAAMGFVRGLLDEGLAIPRDIAVVGIDGTDMCEYLQPPLTSIAQDRQALMTGAIEMIFSMIERKEPPGRKLRVPTRLIARASA